MITTFTRRLQLQQGFTPEFFFNRICMPGGIHFHVSVVDGSGHLHHFTMKEDRRQWRIVNAPQPPQWVINLETELDRVICECMLS